MTGVTIRRRTFKTEEIMYDVKSKKATEFIDHQEILDTLEYAQKNKDNRELIE